MAKGVTRICNVALDTVQGSSWSINTHNLNRSTVTVTLIKLIAIAVAIALRLCDTLKRYKHSGVIAATVTFDIKVKEEEKEAIECFRQVLCSRH